MTDKPHYHGHRERLRGRFRLAGAEAVSDYELLELQSISRQANEFVKECCL
jgi:DNA repair protein RadC